MGTDIECTPVIVSAGLDFVSHDTVKYIKPKRIKHGAATVQTGQSSPYPTFISESSFLSFL